MANNHDVAGDFDKRIHVDRLSAAGIDSEAEQEDMVVGLLLGDLRSFNDAVRDTRVNIGLEEPMPSSERPEITEIMEYSTALGTQQKQQLKTSANDIRSRYGLSHNWEFSVEAAILVNRLFVPPDPSIALVTSNGGSLEEVMANLQTPTPEVFIYPSYQVTINQLHEFIDNHAEEIRAAVAQLPPRPQANVANQTFLIGRMAWMLRSEEPQPSWSEVAERINDFTRRIDVIASTSLNNIQVRTIYERYLSHLTELETT